MAREAQGAVGLGATWRRKPGWRLNGATPSSTNTELSSRPHPSALVQNKIKAYTYFSIRLLLQSRRRTRNDFGMTDLGWRAVFMFLIQIPPCPEPAGCSSPLLSTTTSVSLVAMSYDDFKDSPLFLALSRLKFARCAHITVYDFTPGVRARNSGQTTNI